MGGRGLREIKPVLIFYSWKLIDNMLKKNPKKPKNRIGKVWERGEQGLSKSLMMC